MSSADLQDKRLQERAARGGAAARLEIAKASASLPDLADNVDPRKDADLAQLAEDLRREQEGRKARIARFAEERKAPPRPRPPVQAIDEADL